MKNGTRGKKEKKGSKMTAEGGTAKKGSTTMIGGNRFSLGDPVGPGGR